MDKPSKPALETAARMLAMRSLTRKMLCDKLSEKGYDEDEIVLAADAMEEMGAVDDEEYARVFAADRAARGWGAIRIKQELLHRGTDAETVAEVISELDDPSENIENIIKSRSRGNPLDRKEADKIAASLMRKGFSWEQIRPILNRYRQESFER